VKDKTSFEQLKYMTQFGRNLLKDKDLSKEKRKIKKLEKRKETLLHQKIPILNFLLKNLPKTKHDLSTILFDGHTLQIPNQTTVIFVSLHGRYKNEFGYIRSFDRTFVLVPPPPFVFLFLNLLEIVTIQLSLLMINFIFVRNPIKKKKLQLEVHNNNQNLLK
jgi:hypothetical protein